MELISNWRDFAKATILTNDLDPTYVFLYNAKKELGESWATRFAVHYLCFYDLGGAIRAANQTHDNTFWAYVLGNYREFPRGTERRHSRGELGLGYVTELSKRGSPQRVWEWMGNSRNYSDLVLRFKMDFQNCGFGPYFIWKVLDFQERIWDNPITLSLDEAVKYCPNDSRKCAAILWPDKDFKTALTDVTDYISQFLAPPKGDRPCSYQEAETILCMLKGYFITKTHTIGDDVDSKYAQLAHFPEYHRFLPPKQDWIRYVRAYTVDTKTVSADQP